MSTASSASGIEGTSGEPTPAEALATAPGNEKQTISPAERWLKIHEKACLRAQKRGFVGGNPVDDWSDAEKEVDAKYDTDPHGASLTAPERVTSQIKCILARFGAGDLSVDALLEKHHQNMDKLTALNRTLTDGTAELANRQTALAQEAMHEAVNTLQSVAQGELNTEAMTKQAALSVKAMENALSHLKAVAEAMTGIASGAGKDSSSKS